MFAGLLLSAGAIGDRYGRKGALQAGLAIYALASLGASFAADPVQLIVLRGVMGPGAAFVMPATLSLLSSAFPARERAKAIAVWAGSPSPRPHRCEPVRGRTRRDAFGIIEGPERGWASAIVLVSFAVGGIALALFAWWEQRIDHPMLDVSWFGDRRFSIGASTISLTFFAMFGLFFLLTQYLQFVLGYSPLRAGVATLPMAAMLVVVAPRSAGLVERLGPRRVITTGPVVMAAGFALMVPFTPTTSYWYVVLPLILIGLGAGAVMPPSTGQIMSALPLDRAGVGSAVNDTTRELGGALGVAILGSIVTSGFRTDIGQLLAGVPEQAREVAQRSVAAALEISQNAPDPAAAQVAIRAAFTDAIGVAFAVAAIATLINAAIVWCYGPRVSSIEEIGSPAAAAVEHAPTPEPEPTPVA